MPFQPAPGIAQVEMRFQQNGQRVENVFHVHRAAGWSGSDLTTLAGDFNTWWQTSLRGHVSSSLSLQEVYAVDLSSAMGATATITDGLPVNGSVGSSTPLSNNCTLSIKWNSPYRGRSARGRTYHLGLYEAQCSDPNHISSGDLATLTEAYNALITAVEGVGEGVNLVVLSRVQGGVVLPEATFYNIVNATFVDNVIDSQRRRLPGRGQ